MAHLGGLHLPSLQSRSHDISSICPSQKWSSSGGKVTCYLLPAAGQRVASEKRQVPLAASEHWLKIARLWR